MCIKLPNMPATSIKTVGRLKVGRMHDGTWGAWWANQDIQNDQPAAIGANESEASGFAEILDQERQSDEFVNRG